MNKIKIIGATIMIIGLGLMVTGIVTRIEHGPSMVVYGNFIGGFCLAIIGAVFNFVD